ncbi:pilus assembly protein [Ferrimonas balearica]|uniref:pilus assembly protein n=1 Tax=Ferrimonas balearica TaxID=44012 RepID=UPI001C961906|nr:PilC/PilY family type IV pilus protein [Ferrimonas balearica]MBY5981577.1 type IV pilin biogenesis protein [Ferrimonas balearica]
MQKYRYSGVLAAAFSAIAVVVSNATMADDTELYVAGIQDEDAARPKVLIIFDNSGSMLELEWVEAGPYDPNHDYTGEGGNRLYYVKGAVSTDQYPDPQDNNETRYLYPQNNACAASLALHPSSDTLSILQYEGRFTSGVRHFSVSFPQWLRLPDSIQSELVRKHSIFDCVADLDNADPNNAPAALNPLLRGEGFPQNLFMRSPYDGTSSSASLSERERAADDARNSTQFGQNDVVTLFTENYLTYLHHHSGSVQRQRITIARETTNSLINTTTGVDFGLMVFNRNRNSGNTIGSDDGGRIVEGIREMTESNRADLVNTVSSLEATSDTSLCESLFEAYRYFSGGAVLGGNKGGALLPAADDSVVSGDNYISPLSSCQANSYVLLMTDGSPYRDNSLNTLIESELGLTAADKHNGSHLPGVAEWMYQNDMNTSATGHQKVVTYTVGFSQGAVDAAELLEQTAHRGGGLYYPANDAAALQSSLQQIVSEILSVNTSFTSPSVAANSFDRTQTLDSLYYAMFLPSDRPRWMGNLKKLKVNSEGLVVDQNGVLAINARGNISDGACTYWTRAQTCSATDGGGDGNDVTVGGALEQLGVQAVRRILTDPASGNGALVPLTRASLSSALGSESELISRIGAAGAGELNGYVSWLQGLDPDDEDGDGASNDRRVDLIGDPLHSKPLAINYGGTKGVRILMGTNQGFVHMFKDEDTAISESWAYYLPDMLGTLNELRTNPQTGGHTVYGVDGVAAAYINDVDGDGIIEASTDSVYLYFGLRRGGRAYYALELSDPDNPSRLWKLSNESTGMGELGQSWSEPIITRIPGNNNKPVVIFGGGYDLNKDGRAVGSADNMGRAIYIVDAATGALVHRFEAGAALAEGVTPLPAEDSIAAKISVLDSDGDSVTDRLYAVDTGGNIWRVDMPGTNSGDWSVHHFAELGGNTQANDRRFFGEVSVAQTSFELVENLVVNEGKEGEATVTASSEVPYDAVLVGSGNRAHPNGTGTQNYLFALQDRNIRTQTFGTERNPSPEPIRISNLYSVSGDPFGSADGEEALLAEQLALGQKLGWYFPLAPSEKALSAPLVVSGVAYYTTYVPGTVSAANSCVAPGQGFFYAFSLQDGISINKFSTGEGVPDTPQIVVPPDPDPDTEGWNPQLHLVGVGAGDKGGGTVATNQTLTPQRVYYHYGAH